MISTFKTKITSSYCTFILSFVFVFLCLVQSVFAHRSYDFHSKNEFSDQYDEVKNVEKLPGSTPQELHLKFNIFNTTYLIDLEPAVDLFHPQAKVEIHTHRGHEILPLNVEDHDVYKGKLYHAETEEQLYKLLKQGSEPLGWARITFHSDIKKSQLYAWDDILFEGTLYSSEFGFHHISTSHTVRLKKRNFISADAKNSVLVFKEVNASDRDSQSSCGNTGMKMNPFAAIEYKGLLSSSSFSSYLKGSDDNNFQITHGNDTHSMPSSSTNASSSFKNGANNPKLERRQEGNRASCPQEKMVLFMAAAADCTYVQKYNGAQAALKAILQNWNSATQIYESTFNVALGLIEVKIVSNCGNSGDKGENPPVKWNKPCSNDYTINNRLNDFSEWRGRKSKDQAGLWHLMTQCSSGSSIGIAWPHTLCQVQAETNQKNGQTQFITGTAVSSANAPYEWKVVAHEIGHNFGAIHDCQAANCPTSCSTLDDCACCPCGTGAGCDCAGNYLMNPTDNSKSNFFSQCTIQSICGLYPSLGTCLKPPDSLKTIDVNICGNGVKEGKEECDCGNNCDKNPCCDGATCKLKNGAKCDDFSDTCCRNCQILQKGTICRNSTGICDIQEICDGESVQCPKNEFVADRTPCNGSNNNIGATFCASGVCTNRNVQCTSFSSLVDISGECSGFQDSCNLYCQSKSRNQCLKLNGIYLDGTTCGSDGICKQGRCESTTISGKILQWYRTSPSLAIPITIAAFLVIILFIVFIVRRCQLKRKEQDKKVSSFKKDRGLKGDKLSPVPKDNHKNAKSSKKEKRKKGGARQRNRSPEKRRNEDDDGLENPFIQGGVAAAAGAGAIYANGVQPPSPVRANGANGRHGDKDGKIDKNAYDPYDPYGGPPPKLNDRIYNNVHDNYTHSSSQNSRAGTPLSYGHTKNNSHWAGAVSGAPTANGYGNSKATYYNSNDNYGGYQDGYADDMRYDMNYDVHLDGDQPYDPYDQYPSYYNDSYQYGNGGGNSRPGNASYYQQYYR